MEPIALMDALEYLESIKSGSMSIFQALEQIYALSCINLMKLPYSKNKKSDFFFLLEIKKLYSKCFILKMTDENLSDRNEL